MEATLAKTTILSRITQMPLKLRIPLFIAGFSLITGAAVGYQAVSSLSAGYQERTEKLMLDKLQAQEKALGAFMEGMVSNLHAIADNPYIMRATKDFTNAYAAVGGDKVKYLQDEYITKNPNELEAFDGRRQ